MGCRGQRGPAGAVGSGRCCQGLRGIMGCRVSGGSVGVSSVGGFRGLAGGVEALGTSRGYWGSLGV